MIQNQTGNNPTKWDKTGVVLENKPHSQVLVRVDGSRRVTLRNRRFIKELHPSLARMTPEPVKTTPRKKRVPKAAHKVPETRQEQPPPETQAGSTPACTVPEAPQQDPIPTAPETQAGRTPTCTVPEATQEPAPPPLYTPYQALEGLNERLDDGVEPDEVDTETPPDQPIQEVNEPPSPSLAQTRPRRIPKPNPKYSPDTYDLSYVGVKSRTRSRRSVRRAGK